jgi:hypothetical protein
LASLQNVEGMSCGDRQPWPLSIKQGACAKALGLDLPKVELKQVQELSHRDVTVCGRCHPNHQTTMAVSLALLLGIYLASTTSADVIQPTHLKQKIAGFGTSLCWWAVGMVTE